MMQNSPEKLLTLLTSVGPANDLHPFSNLGHIVAVDL